MKNSRRVVITGLGVVAPNGIGKETFWQNLIAGKSAIDYITAFDASAYPCQVAGEIRDFDPKAFMTTRKAKVMGRFSQLAVAATRLAVEDANLTISGNLSQGQASFMEPRSMEAGTSLRRPSRAFFVTAPADRSLGRARVSTPRTVQLHRH